VARVAQLAAEITIEGQATFPAPGGARCDHRCDDRSTRSSADHPRIDP
jgi:hypothetical protein